MKLRLNLIFYITVVCLLTGLILFVINAGRNLELPTNLRADLAPQESQSLLQALKESSTHPVAVFVLQIIITLIAAKLCGNGFRKIGQPAVIGEIVAGILLGPSLMGFIAPQISNLLFPASSTGSLQLVSQLGLVFFMFMAGMELNFGILFCLKFIVADFTKFTQKVCGKVKRFTGEFTATLYPGRLHLLHFFLLFSLSPCILKAPILVE